jgi:hypothetical protein
MQGTDYVLGMNTLAQVGTLLIPNLSQFLLEIFLFYFILTLNYLPPPLTPPPSPVLVHQTPHTVASPLMLHGVSHSISNAPPLSGHPSIP